jgi:hypothetical protein
MALEDQRLALASSSNCFPDSLDKPMQIAVLVHAEMGFDKLRKYLCEFNLCVYKDTFDWLAPSFHNF